MKRIYTITLGLLLSCNILMAQDAPVQQTTTKTFTLEQCIQYALENSVTSKNATLDQEIAVARVRETTGLGLPQVSGAVGLQYNSQIRRLFLQYTGPGGFIDLSGIPNIQPGDIAGLSSPFQLPATGDAGLNVSQLIFNGSYIVGLQAAKTYKELAVRNGTVSKVTMIQTITKAYYGVLVNEERATLFDANLGRVDTLLRNTIALNKNGFAEAIDVDRIRVTYNNLLSEREKFVNLKELSKALLKFQMNYPLEQEIEIVGSIQDMRVESNLDSYKDGWDYKTRPDYQVMETNYRLQQLNVKNQYAGALPSISGIANLGYFTGSKTFMGLFKTDASFAEVKSPQGNSGPDKWYPYSMVGLNLSWNLFTGLQRNYRIQQEKLSLIKIKNQMQNVKTGIDLEIQQSTIGFNNALKTLEAQSQNMELAAKVAKVTSIKYEQGVGSNLEVVTAESSLREAQTNYYNALYDALIAKVDLDKAYGKIEIPVTGN